MSTTRNRNAQRVPATTTGRNRPTNVAPATTTDRNRKKNRAPAMTTGRNGKTTPASAMRQPATTNVSHRRPNPPPAILKPHAKLHRAPLGVTKVPLLDLDLEKTYVKWNKNLLELNDDLISEHICPSDLNGVPCEHDELKSGCQLLRLCRNLTRHTSYKCPNGLEQNKNCQPCRHIHDEVKMSCRFAAKEHRPPHSICERFDDPDRTCRFGHDHPEARRDAYDHYHIHLLEARREGSEGIVKFEKIW